MFVNISWIESSIWLGTQQPLAPMLLDFVLVVRSWSIRDMRSWPAPLQTSLSKYSRYSCPARKMKKSSRELGSEYNKYLVRGHMTANPLSTLYPVVPL